MYTKPIEAFYPIYVPSYKGHSPVGGHFRQEPAIPLSVELSPIYNVCKFVKPIDSPNPRTGGILDVLA